MTVHDREYFTDTLSADLAYVGEGVTVDADFDPNEASTITRDDHWVDFFGTDKFVEFEATVAQPLIQPYVYNDTLHRFRKTKSELQKAQAQIDNLPWTMGHPEQDRVTDASQIRGVWTNPRWEDGQIATLHIPATDTEAIRYAVRNDEVSIGFGGRLDWSDDSTDTFDATQRDIAYDHIASVENGRCPPDEGCGLHTDAQRHGHTVVTDVMLPQYEEGDIVGHRLFPDFVGMVEHNPDNPEIVMVSALDKSGDRMVKTGHTITAGPSDLIPMDDSAIDGAMTDALQTQLTEERDHSDGDWVQWSSSGETAYGKIDEIIREGCTTRGTGDMEVCADPDDPAVVVEVYDDETGESQDEMVRHKMSTLSSWSGPMTDSACGHVCSPGPCSCGAHDPLTDVTVGGEDIDLVPPEAAQNAAQDALNARADDDIEVNGMTDHGWARAEQLASGEELAPSDIVGGRGAMAAWWSRHGPDILTSDGETLSGTDKDNPWADNSYTAGKGWGGITGMKWALRKGNEIKRARGEDPIYDDSQHAPDGIHVSDGDWYGIAPAENPDGEPKYELNTCNDVKDAYNLRNNGDYGIETSTLVTRIKRAADIHDCPPEQKPWQESAQSDNQSSHTKNLSDSHNSDTPMTNSLTEFIDEHDLTVEDVIDDLDLEVPDEPTAFYDGEPDIETLADDFDAVDLLVDEKETIEAERDSLREDLRDARRPLFSDKADKLASKTHKWGDKDDLMAKFDADDAEERWTIDDIDEALELVADIIDESSTTTITDSTDDGGDDSQSRPDIQTTETGGFDLRNRTKVE